MANRVWIKKLQVNLEIKNNGIEFDVSDKAGHRGDLFVTKTGLTWCEGKTIKKRNEDHLE